MTLMLAIVLAMASETYAAPAAPERSDDVAPAPAPEAPNSSGFNNSSSFSSDAFDPSGSFPSASPPPPDVVVPRHSQPRSNNGANWGKNRVRNNYDYDQPQDTYQRPQSRSYGLGPQPAHSQQHGIRIICPSDCVERCRYTLLNASGKAFDYAISGGEYQNLKGPASWRIRYDQGNNRGYRTYSLKNGAVYELKQSGDGSWVFRTVGEL